MKPPPKPPAPPTPNRGASEPSSGRGRNDASYAQPPASNRAGAPVPSSSEPPHDPPYLDSGEDATPMRVPTVGDLEPISPPTTPVEWKPQPIPTSPIEPATPPRHFAPPPSTPHVHAISSARVRQGAPIAAPPPYSPPYPSPPGPVVPHQVTGPMQPVPTHQPLSESFAVATGTHSQRSVANADEGMHLGYVVASAFFLAIALVGFGLYLAFEVISL